LDVLVSQPLLSMPSQLANGGLQPVSVHVPVAHDAVPLVREQGTPQPPQLLLVVVDVSQPLLGSPSQLWKPELQLGEQVPFTQAVLPCAFVHCVVQLPQ
jgi:hypothetical protein